MLHFGPTNSISTMPEIITAKSLLDTEYQPYFQTYIDLVGDDDVRHLLKKQIPEFENLFGRIDEATSQIVHSPYGWTIRQVVGHLIDGEKIFGTRGHKIACGENQPLAGFDQDLYVSNTEYSGATLADLVSEFILIRESNILMFNRWSDSMWQQSGICDGQKLSVKAIACILVGHLNHHLRIVEKRINS